MALEPKRKHTAMEAEICTTRKYIPSFTIINDYPHKNRSNLEMTHDLKRSELY